MDPQFQCCDEFFPIEVRAEEKESSEKSDNLPEDQIYAKLAALMVPRMNAESENPKRRRDGSYIILLSGKLTPWLKEHLTNKRNEREKKHKHRVRLIRLIVIGLIICGIIFIINK